MKCMVIESNGTPHIYGTLKEARAELKANGYSYSRAEDRYYIAGTDYTARIVRSDSNEYADRTKVNDLPYMIWEDKPETQTAENYAAEDAANSLINAYAEAIGEYPAETDPEYMAAYRVAGEEIAAWSAADATDRAHVAHMVQAIADHAPAATKKQAEKQAERYAISADINETRAYDEMQEALAAIKHGDIESAETAAAWAKTYADRTESDAAKAAAAAEQAGTANAAEWADQAKGRIEYARRCANAAAEELAAAKVEDGDITIDKFVTTTADEWGEAFGLIDLKAGTTAYQLKTTAHLYTIGFTEAWDGSGAWVCQIDEMENGHMGGCEACYTGETPTEALENACVEACVYPAMRENDNAEDAVNAASYGAYEMLHSHQWPQTAEQYDELNRMMGTAANIVHRSGKAYGIQWEPYRACDEAAENAANSLLSAYADTISTNSAEYRAAHNVAAEEVAGLEAVADMTDREIVARMVEEIAQRNQR